MPTKITNPITETIGPAQTEARILTPDLGNAFCPKLVFRIIWRKIAPCTKDANRIFTSDPRKTHIKAVVNFAFGDCARLKNVCSLGLVRASPQTETQSETPPGGGTIGVFI